MTASCLSCSQNKSIEEFCKNPENNSIPGCKIFGKKYCLTKEVWSQEKKEWCCENEKLGCGKAIFTTHFVFFVNQKIFFLFFVCIQGVSFFFFLILFKKSL